MIELSIEDLQAIQEGKPPQSAELLKHLCVNTEWLEILQEYCLKGLISTGSSKVKLIHGHSATGKSHYLQSFKVHAEEAGYYSLYLNLMEADFYLNDIVSLYRCLAAKLDINLLASGLRQNILNSLGYQSEEFMEYGGTITDFLHEKEQATPAEAKRQIRSSLYAFVNSLEVDFAFRKFLSIFGEAVMEDDKSTIELAGIWLKGYKINRVGKVQSSLYETLNRDNARIWLYSLVVLIKLSGYKGVLVILDQLEAILPKSNALMRYTPMRRNDVYELLRQLIDEMDFFRNMLILVAGSTDLLENERFGLQSYHALWMRIQPGFSYHGHVNPYSDLIDANQMLADVAAKGELKLLSEKIRNLSRNLLPDDQNPTLFWDEGSANFRDIIHNSMLRYTEEGYTDAKK